MTRGNFTGSRMTGTIGAGTKRRSMKEMYMLQAKGESVYENMTDDERYKKILEDKLEELRHRAKNARKPNVILPGTDPGAERELSATAQKVIDDIIEKKAKKFAKEKSRMVRVKPKVFTGMQGGRIDAKGNIFGPDNRWIATVDKKTGKVRSRRGGFTICKYKANSSICEFRITQFIQNEYRTRKGNLYAARGHGGINYGIYGEVGSGLDGGAGLYSMQGQGAFWQPGGTDEGVWGVMGNDESLWGWDNTKTSNTGGGVWGGGGGIWGNNDDNKGGGFWG